MLKVYAQELGSITILCLQGRIGIAETDSLCRAVYSQLDADAVVLDLTHVISIDASGLGTLLKLREWTVEKGVQLKLLNVPERVGQLLSITCLNSVFEISSESELVLLATTDPETSRPTIRHCGHVIANEGEMIGNGASARLF